MKKWLLVFFLWSMNNCSAYCQTLSGIYEFSCSKLNGYNAMYINFSKTDFIYFSLGSSIHKIDAYDELKEIATGKYSLTNNKIILNFKTDSTYISPYIYDSVVMFFSSKKNQNTINIAVEFNTSFPKFSPASLIIETASKEYVEKINFGVSKVVALPQGTIIKSIKIAAIGTPAKYLPFDLNYNNLKYTFFAEDDKSAIEIVADQTLEFDIKKSTVNALYIFGKSQYLKKVDSKQLDYLKRLSIQKEPRLIKALNYPF